MDQIEYFRISRCSRIRTRAEILNYACDEIADPLSSLGNSRSFCLIYSKSTFLTIGARAATQGCALGSKLNVRAKSSASPHMPGKWKRICSPWSRYAPTLPTAFDWRRPPARQSTSPFSSKWPNDGLRSPSMPRRRKQIHLCEGRLNRRRLCIWQRTSPEVQRRSDNA
jgi:hypothetical protein